MNIPWVESPFFKDEIEKRNLSDEMANYAKALNENGVVVLREFFSSNEMDQAREAIVEEHDDQYTNPRATRVQDLWKGNGKAAGHVKDIASNSKLLEILETLYDRKPIPFQTLNFKWGSQQKGHSDCIHFDSMPGRFMVGIWVAMEDASLENGTIFYYPGSHKLPVYHLHHIMQDFETIGVLDDYSHYTQHYEPFIGNLMDAHGLEKDNLKLNKGDAVIWCANVVHGGNPILQEGRTRWSQVTHYYFEDCIYFTPLFSNVPGGDYLLRTITDIGTGKETTDSYNGQPVQRRHTGPFLCSISPSVDKSLGQFDWLANNLLYRLMRKVMRKLKGGA